MVLAAVLSIMLSVLGFRTGVDATARSDPLSSGRASRHTASLTRATQQNQAQLVTKPIGALFPYEDHRSNKLAPQAKACLFPDFSRLANVGGHHQPRRSRHKSRTGKGTNQQLHRRLMQVDAHGHNHETEQRMRTGTGVSHVDNTEADNEYLIEVWIGTPGQRVLLLPDTGSWETWAYGPTCCFASNHSFFDPGASETYANRTVNRGTGESVRVPRGQPGDEVTLEYGARNRGLRGYAGSDTVSLSQTTPDLKVRQATVIVATDIVKDTVASQRKLDGIMGFAPSSYVTPRMRSSTVSPMELLVREGHLYRPFLSLTLVKADRRTGVGLGGRITFGDVDLAAVMGHREDSFEWFPSDAHDFWGGFLAAEAPLLINGEAVQWKINEPVNYILDTGSALISLPREAAALLNGAIPGAFFVKELGRWSIPCATGLDARADRNPSSSSESSPPPPPRPPPAPIISFGIGHTTFSIPASDLVFFPKDPLPPSLTSGREGLCFSAIQGFEETFVVLGTVFLRSYAVTFDYGPGAQPDGPRRIGIARRTDVTYPSQT
ncbi:acid protease [Acaromyces ingoldii]|uniref:Acid protease n=1 Tax=Acaromyces ingoldii TaxID=215250 RepID=A0A316YU57_9BASI|nr:acid protease [Acaromyces ingoldii]PWN92967.1 acid protease [Acaromyces ingoldii]